MTSSVEALSERSERRFELALQRAKGARVLGVRPYAIDPDPAKRLWTWSERWL